ncbi:MAG: cyclic nucleotide-binding domain-containing protein [Alphaproteobacteria bacterium]|nr:cyclic nucleotide-binding domain-containing protein [Alphaproteobacteria bacterium]MBU0796520.1 cyclic nucleotide-binding domain-containing protein [Alphaproteobacteria bacterium]MBU0888066.1 cyclic nucleotide-binding domain-containing protein [Alphaproteobacteria bacterium]MBU1811511.1 cyclic nucleotide-binding domain-containing protein [Alphaproteobacteria bacterium]MBU2090850.1 cyclic nucleotide-binding domain-containing protein [Alphaproteobacteria bacterium]
MQAFEGHQFAAGTTIIHEGTRADAAFVLEKGIVEIYRSIGGQEMVIARLGPGAIFGEMALLERRTHNAGVRAVEDCVCAVVTEKLFWKLLDEANPFLRALLMQFSRNLGTTTRQATDLQAMLGMGRGEDKS